MKQVFLPGFVYPSDEIGTYDDLQGKIVEICRDRIKVEVPDYGTFTGYSRILEIHPERVPSLEWNSKIRIYRDWPDNRILGWSSNGPL